MTGALRKSKESDLLVPKEFSTYERKAWKKPRSDADHIAQCLYHKRFLSAWEIDFLRSVAKRDDNCRILTDGQYDKLREISTKIRGHLRRRRRSWHV